MENIKEVILKKIEVLQAKLMQNEWKFPKVEAVWPYFISILGGFILANLLTVIYMTATDIKSKQNSYAFAENLAFQPIIPVPQEIPHIVSRNIFNSAGGVGNATQDSQCELKKSTLALKFSGIIYGGSAETSLVLIENTIDKTAAVLLLGQTLPGDSTIIDIQPNRVILQRENSCPEYLELEAPELPKPRRVASARSKKSLNTDEFEEPGFVRKANKIETSREYLNAVITRDLPKTLQDAKASPYLVNGQIKGFQLTRIKPDSIYTKLGFQDGDVVVAINGIELTSAPGAIQTLNALRNESYLEVLVDRNGQQFTMTVNVR